MGLHSFVLLTGAIALQGHHIHIEYKTINLTQTPPAHEKCVYLPLPFLSFE